MDRALWIVKYDLPDTGRDAYLDWMHGTYMPRLVERPGVSWAVHLLAEGKDVPTPGRQHAPAGAVPGGYHYSLVAGGRDAHVFADPTPAQFHAALPAADREMLAMRIGESMSVMVEQARIDGPEAGKRNPNVALSPCILLGSLNLEGGNDDEILTWFAQVRFPAMKTLPGFVGMRKLVAVSGWAKHGMVYEFESVAAMVENYPKVIQNVSPEAAASNKAIMAKSIHAPGSPNVCTRIASVLSKRHAA